MHSKLNLIAKSMSAAFFANIFSLFVSCMTVLILPKFLGVEAYGYYQLYLFYINYVGIMYFGWCEGINLRIGGKFYDDLDKPLYCTQYWILCIAETLIFLSIYLVSSRFTQGVDKTFVIGCTCVVGVAMCLRWFVATLLAGTARIQEYSFQTILEKLVFSVASLVLLLGKQHNYKLFILSSVISVYISLGYSVLVCKDVVFTHFVSLRFAFSEIKENISAGIKLMFANLFGILIIGVTRFGVEAFWDIATFSRVSLTLSISNLMMTAISAIAIVLYPMLRRVEEQQLPNIYGAMRVLMMGLILGVMAFYYPLQRILSAWLPQYAESIRYAAILFPICVYESKMSMLINTYFKTLRLEKQLMRCNMAALAMSGILTVLSTVVLHNVTFAIISILICLVFRGIISELLLAKHIDIEVKKDIVIELCMTVAFIICNWFFGFLGMLMYAGCYVLYLLVKKNDILETVSFIRSMR